MVAEATCVSKPWTVIPMVVTGVQDFIAAGQFRGGEQLVDPQQVTRPGTILVFLEPLYEGGLDGVTPAAAASPTPTAATTTSSPQGNVGATKGLVLHAVDAVGLVHAMILRICGAAADPAPRVQRGTEASRTRALAIPLVVRITAPADGLTLAGHWWSRKLGRPRRRPRGGRAIRRPLPRDPERAAHGTEARSETQHRRHVGSLEAGARQQPLALSRPPKTSCAGRSGALSPRGLEARHGALQDEAALELKDRADDVEHEAAGRTLVLSPSSVVWKCTRSDCSATSTTRVFTLASTRISQPTRRAAARARRGCRPRRRPRNAVARGRRLPSGRSAGRRRDARALRRRPRDAVPQPVGGALAVVAPLPISSLFGSAAPACA